MNQDTRQCSKCHEIKPLIDFYYRKQRKNYRYDCKLCTNKHRKEYYSNNKNKELTQNNKWYLIHKKDRDIQKVEYYTNNREKIIKQTILRNKVKYHENSDFRLRTNIRHRILKEFNDKNVKKQYKTIDLLGYSIKEYHNYIEILWYNEMVWNTRGIGPNKWQIHHICPIEFFDIRDPVEQKQAIHYTNTKPLWYGDHIEEHRKINERMKLYDLKDIYPWKY